MRKYQLQLHSLLDQVFPEYSGVFGSLYSKGSLLTLLTYPTSKAVLSTREREITAKKASRCDWQVGSFCTSATLYPDHR